MDWYWAKKDIILLTFKCRFELLTLFCSSCLHQTCSRQQIFQTFLLFSSRREPPFVVVNRKAGIVYTSLPWSSMVTVWLDVSLAPPPSIFSIFASVGDSSPIVRERLAAGLPMLSKTVQTMSIFFPTGRCEKFAGSSNTTFFGGKWVSSCLSERSVSPVLSLGKVQLTGLRLSWLVAVHSLACSEAG